MENLVDLTLTQAARLISQGELSPLELTQAYLDRIETIDPQLGSFITVTAKRAFMQAEQAEAEIQHGKYRGALHGIPVGLKDVFETDGVRTSAGSKLLRDYAPTTDSTVVKKLKAAGAVLLGKTNLSEWTMKPSNENPFFGPCCNPWDTERSPGGSSGGSAAALAASLCLGTLGTDTGGSVRIPAGLCGIVGLKPTYGRISVSGVLPLSWHLDHVGLMARQVSDLAIMLQILAGYDPDGPWSSDMPVGDYQSNLQSDIRGVRIAWIQDDYISSAEAEVLNAVTAAVEVLQQLGARVQSVAMPELSTARQVNSTILLSDAAEIHHERMRQQPEQFSPEVLTSLERGAAMPATDYAQARRRQAQLRREIEAYFVDCDILLTPTTPTVAPLRHESSAMAADRPSLTGFTAAFNLLGLPAASIPCGFSEAGLPIGMQLVARSWCEVDLFRAGSAYERVTNWHRIRPEL